jgi:LPXTG-motif cell wall-anchored protein
MLPPPPTTPLGSTSSPLTPILIGTGVLAAGGVAWWLVRRRERAARPRPSRR